MKYLRLYADKEGESHFEDVSVDMSSVELAPPAPPMNVAEFLPSNRYTYIEVPADWDGGRHCTPTHQVVVVLSGGMEFTASNGEVRQVLAGSVISIEDTTV